MNEYRSQRPLSPGSTALFLFTTLCDEQTASSTGEHANAQSLSVEHSQHLEEIMIVTSDRVDKSLQTIATQQERSTGSKTFRVAKPKVDTTVLPGYACFSAATGEAAMAPKRSVFSPERRMEVKKVRQLGACLRCRLLKRTVSLIWKSLFEANTR